MFDPWITLRLFARQSQDKRARQATIHD